MPRDRMTELVGLEGRLERSDPLIWWLSKLTASPVACIWKKRNCIKIVYILAFFCNANCNYLKLPSGGEAYGTPRYASTIGGDGRISIPLNGPYFVLTTLLLYLTLCMEPDITGTQISNNKNKTFK